MGQILDPGQEISDLEPGWAFYSSQFGATRLGNYKTTPGPPPHPPSGLFTDPSQLTHPGPLPTRVDKRLTSHLVLKRSVRPNWSSLERSRPAQQVAHKSQLASRVDYHFLNHFGYLKRNLITDPRPSCSCSPSSQLIISNRSSSFPTGDVVTQFR